MFSNSVIPESPRWLLVTERKKEAHELIRRIAKCNKVTLPDDLNVTVKVIYEHF